MNKAIMKEIAARYGLKVRFVETSEFTIVRIYKKIGKRWKYIGPLHYYK
jgi:hypothetical protein